MSAIPGLNTAILDFCTRLDDGPRDEGAARRELPRRDPAEWQWLKEAIASIEQPEARLKKLLTTLDEPDKVSSQDEAAVAALEEIVYMVEDINLATEFYLMKGPARTIRLLAATRDTEIRRLAATIVANSAQNHEKLQAAFVELKFADVLVPLMAAETDAATRAALVFAVSCTTRGYAPAAAAFLKAGGLGALLSVITTYALDDAKSVGRCLRLVGYFAEEHATTATPIADAVCGLVNAMPTERDAGDDAEAASAAAAPSGPSTAVMDAAVDAATQILRRALLAGDEGRDLAAATVSALHCWVARNSNADTEEDKALIAAYKDAVASLGGAAGNQNKSPQPTAPQASHPAPAGPPASADPPVLLLGP
jgi:hypothetical protein